MVTVTGNPGGDAAPTVGFTVDARIILSPTSGPAGSTISYAGSGFTGAGALACTPPPDITGTPVDAATKVCNQDAQGNVVGSFKIAAGAASGSYIITYTDAGGVPRTATLVVTGATGGPIVTLSPNTGPTSTVVTVSGSGFAAGDTTVSFTTTVGPSDLFTPGTRICTVSGGNIAAGCSFVVKSNALGVAPPGYTVKFTGNTGDFSNAQFLVISALFLTPTNGGTAALVTMSGSGYKAAVADCTPFMAGSPAPLTSAPVCSINADGVLTGSFTVNAGTSTGLHTLTITSAALVVQTMVSASFTVTLPTVNLSPNTGSGGDMILVSASGFSSGDTACTITGPAGVFEVVPSCSITGGVVTGSFIIKIAGNARSPKLITVTGTLGDSASATLNVVPKISLSPNPVRVGSIVTITGSNFDATDATLTCNPPVSTPGGAIAASTCTVNADFTVTGSFTVPAAGATSTSYLITVTGTGGTPGSASATLNIIPRIVILTPSFGPRGASIAVGATGFSLGDVTCTITGPAVTGGASCAITGGTVTGSFIVFATVVPGTSTVTVTGSMGDVGMASFTVTPGISLLPTTGRPGTSVLVSGSNFAAADTGCSISSVPGGLILNPICTVAGSAMSGSFVVASGAGGSYSLVVTGNTGDAGSASFTVPPPPTLTLGPASGPPGTSVSASGANYAGTTCLLSSNPAGLFVSQACSVVAGFLTGSFTVASGAATGSYTVTVQTNGGSGDSATAAFMVTAGTATTTTSATASTTTTSSFSLLINPSALVLNPGGTASVSVTVQSQGVFNSPVNLEVVAFPASVSGGFSSNPVTPPPGGSVSTLLSLAVASNAQPTTTVLQIRATGDSLVVSGTLALNVAGGAAGAATLILAPVSGPAGAAITAFGSNHLGTSCLLSSNPVGLFVSQACAVSSGTVTGTFTVSLGAGVGGYVVTVTTNGGTSASALFSVTAVSITPTVTVTPTASTGLPFPFPPTPVPGFPWESILAGLAAGLLALGFRRRGRTQTKPDA